MNELQIFRNEEFGEIRTAEANGEPWFAGKDVCTAFGDKNHSRSLSRVDEADKVTLPVTDSLGREQTAIFVNESGLYSLLFSMQPQKANNGGSDAYPIEVQERIEKLRRFKRWVTSEVLPSIRKTGSYSMQAKLPVSYAEALRELADTVEQRERLALENAELKPKAEFYDTVTGSEDAIDMGSVAKVLNMGIGRNKLFQILRDRKILQPNNRPYQTYIDRGYFRCIESSYTKPNGDTCVNIKTVVYQKGVDFIRKTVKGA